MGAQIHKFFCEKKKTKKKMLIVLGQGLNERKKENKQLRRKKWERTFVGGQSIENVIDTWWK